MKQEKKVILLAGPTASGKSKLALRLTKNLNGAILQPLNYINLIYYYKPKRNIQTYKEASIIQKYNDISNSITIKKNSRKVHIKIKLLKR